VKLGQSEESLKRELGGELVKAKGGDYAYTSGQSRSRRSEALIVVDKKKVVVIKAGQEPDRQGQDPSNKGYVSQNRQLQTGVGAGLESKSLLAIPGKLTFIDRKLKSGLKAKGYILKNSKATKSYYFVNPCSAGDKVILLAVAFNKYESRAIGDGPGCSTHAG
jgi:hypothetical protein